jgi:hypothetical protein
MQTHQTPNKIADAKLQAWHLALGHMHGHDGKGKEEADKQTSGP